MSPALEPPGAPVSGERWRISVDTGGTFTDCLAVDPRGNLHRAKVLSSSSLRGRVIRPLGGTALRIAEEWGAAAGVVRGSSFRLLGVEAVARVADHDVHGGTLVLEDPLPPGCVAGAGFELVFAEEAPVLAARLVTGTPAGQPLPPLEMRLATTRGTNALLERRGAAVAFFTTRGFGDVLRIGTQQRPELFALDVRRPPPLAAHVVEVEGRIAADGEEITPLRLDLEAEVQRLLGEGVDVAAVALVNAYRDPSHERAVGEALRSHGFRHVSLSTDLARGIKLHPRAQTAVVDAYLSPVLGDYLAGVVSGLALGRPEADPAAAASAAPAIRLHVMTSAGGLVRPQEFRPKDSLLSGPAGGMVGAARAGRRSGFERVIAFDMGGTSTDVARHDQDFEYVWQHEVAGVQLLAPALAITSVAAGGGSICASDARGLRVGPESAGSLPGPACYGAGGPLTLTDVNLLLGRLDAERFGIPVFPDAARAALTRLRREMAGGAAAGEGEARSGDELLLEGLLEIANEAMADAIRGISLRQGYDPADYALVAFGGAGGQHACSVAERLGMSTVIVPLDAGLLSAYGLGAAVLERFTESQILLPLEEVEPGLPALCRQLEDAAVAAVSAEGIPAERVLIRRRIANLRYLGQESTLPVEIGPGEPLGPRFEARYREVYGHTLADQPVELESVRVVASSEPPVPNPLEPLREHTAAPVSRSPAWVAGDWVELPVFEREMLRPGARFSGPAFVRERHSATFVAGGWEAMLDGAGALVMKLVAAHVSRAIRPHREAPPEVVQELFVSRFRSLVSEMGDQLQRTALSTNVKERLDFSCALLDAQGELVVNAPHIPVHLGALGLCVRAVRDAMELRPGDVVVTNHPAFGGSHLPDVTVITPVHGEDSELIGYVASRAHHAEIGGTRPGSMPPAATRLEEEGVVIAPTLLARDGEARWESMRAILESPPHPSRDVAQNLADLRAQLAANHRGAELLRALADAHGGSVLQERMEALKARAETRIREALLRLGEGSYEALERLDDGSPLRVRVEVRGAEALFDFTGSAAVHPGNLNATPAIVRSAVLYLLRLMVAEPIPLNEGLMRAVRVHLPPGLLNPDFTGASTPPPAVVGGNTEVSQRLVDTLIRALRLSACGQGTMNNVLWGTERFGYYETVAGGAGAGPGWHGESGVHVHMTNTRITDVEVLEHRFPVRVERFSLRRGSGGAGRWRGGDGVVREITFLQPMSLSVLTQHRVEAPYGLAGGAPGALGRQTVVRASGERLALGPVDGCEVEPGDRLVLETPGGGGWGREEELRVES